MHAATEVNDSPQLMVCKHCCKKRWDVCRTGSKIMLTDKWWKTKVFLFLLELLKDFWSAFSRWAAI